MYLPHEHTTWAHIQHCGMKLTAIGIQEFPSYVNPIEFCCIVEGSKALLIQSIFLSVGATLQYGIYPVT